MATTESNTAESNGHRKTVIIVGLIAAVLIVGLFYLLMRASSGGRGTPPTLQTAIRSGSPEWDQYSKKIVLDEPEANEARRALGDIVMSLRTTVRNFTGRTLSGLELRAAVVDHQGKAVRERTLVVVPTVEHPELAPNKTMAVNAL